MARSLSVQPVVGRWFSSGEEVFEVVAADEDDGTIEIQHHDGSVEELDVEDWAARAQSGVLRATEQPEDYTGALDIEADDSGRAANVNYDPDYDGEYSLQAGRSSGLDLFE